VRILPWSGVENGATGAAPEGFTDWFLNRLVEVGQLLYKGLVALVSFLADLAAGIVDWGMRAEGVRFGRGLPDTELLRPCSRYIHRMKFKVQIEKDEDGRWVATVPALPGCISQGRTAAEARKNVKEAIALHLSSLAEDGVPIRRRRGVVETVVTVKA
jgi:predicted RNase H-like HicB family nuclease